MTPTLSNYSVWDLALQLRAIIIENRSPCSFAIVNSEGIPLMEISMTGGEHLREETLALAQRVARTGQASFLANVGSGLQPVNGGLPLILHKDGPMIGAVALLGLPIASVDIKIRDAIARAGLYTSFAPIFRHYPNLPAPHVPR